MKDPNPSEKKGFSNSVVMFLVAIFLIALTLQNILETNLAKVTFSYQLEHLVNLDLLKPEDSRKVAMKDNLVAFSGRFREHVTEEGKKRYKYLEFLDAKHRYVQEYGEISKDLTSLRLKIEESAQFFLQISGLQVVDGGYVVAKDSYNHLVQREGITINAPEPVKTEHKNQLNLVDLKEELQTVIATPTALNVDHLGNDIIALTEQFLSLRLGIGNEALKQKLRLIESEINKANSVSLTDRVAVYKNSIATLDSVVRDLNNVEDGFRLVKLRSVRNYKEALESLDAIAKEMEDNRVQLDRARQAVASVIWYFNNKELTTRALEKQDAEQYAHWFSNAKQEWDRFNVNRGGYFKAPDQPLNIVLEKTFRSEEPQPQYMNYLFPGIIGFVVIIVLYLLFARQVRGVGSSAMSFGKSPARLILPTDPDRITFKDVAGVDEALEELEEIVEFLKSPQKFTSLGGRIPKGVLCIGPPGTGKTLIAKAVAGEANRPFFSISGSDFVEMFVGVGASRIRDLFDQAKKQAPCIIFIDEIDAVGRHRGVGIGGGHDEREQTLNQLLVEMDGFTTNEGVILMAATNRPDVLDRALLRPGRFDRRVIISLPDIKGRYEILKVHARKIKMDQAVELMVLARTTPGCSGADLSNMLNEAALLAARRGRRAVTMQEVMEARDKVLYGKERRSLEVDEQEKKTTAYHESGHAIVGLIVEHADPIDKITIIPRGMALGATMFMPEKNRVSYWKKELQDQLAVLMGGRAAEEIFIGDVSSGAQHDFERATELARNMVCAWGMSDNLGAVAYDDRIERGEYGIAQHEKHYSEATAEKIDAEVKGILYSAHAKAREIIDQHRDKVELMTSLLIKYETLEREDVALIMNGGWSDEDKDRRIKLLFEQHKIPQTPPPPPPPLSSVEVSS